MEETKFCALAFICAFFLLLLHPLWLVSANMEGLCNFVSFIVLFRREMFENMFCSFVFLVVVGFFFFNEFG